MKLHKHCIQYFLLSKCKRIKAKEQVEVKHISSRVRAACLILLFSLDCCFTFRQSAIKELLHQCHDHFESSFNQEHVLAFSFQTSVVTNAKNVHAIPD